MFYIVGNNAGLDLVNTRVVQEGKPVDLIRTFEGLIHWSTATGLIDERRARQIIRKWNDTADAERVIARAHRLRDSLASVTEALLESQRPPSSALEDINSLLRRKSGWFELRAAETGYSKIFYADLDDIDGILVPVAESIADLLCYGDLSQVKRCEGEQCVLVFYDTSKNHRRRWCSMAACGNRAKASAFYRRSKADREVKTG